MTWSPRYPAPLSNGARIFVTAPSSGVPAALHERLDIVLGHLRNQGYVVEEGACLRAKMHAASATTEERASELMHAWLRPDVAAVLPPWGGERAIDLLDRLDWDALSHAEPKWFGGFSDLSTLMLPLLLRSRWASFHGSNLMDLSPSQRDPLTANTHRVLSLQPGARWTQTQSDAHLTTRGDWEGEPSRGYQLDRKTRWRRLFGRGEVQARGRLLGGCLDTLMHLVGTPYGDVPRFVGASKGQGCILFLENCELVPVGVLRAMRQLSYAGWFEGLSALLIGRSTGQDATDATALTYEDALREALEGLDCPVLIDVDIGHTPPQLTIVQGALAELSWDETTGGQLTQTLV